MWCRTIWQARDAQIVARDVMGLDDAESWVARVEIWESDSEEAEVPWVEYRAYDDAGRMRVAWRRRE